MSSFVLKMIAAVTMFVDHAGLLLFPELEILRVIGRLAFPIYAYCIAEGFRYTRNRRLYFLRVFLLGLACQIVYTVVDRTLYLGILMTFSLSILLMACADHLKRTLRSDSGKRERATAAALFTSAVAAAFLLCLAIEVDYGFFGIMLPVFTSVFEDRPRRLVMFTATLIAVSIDMVSGGFIYQFWCLLAVPLLALYNGKPGKYRLKHFFYIFYPAHLVFLYAVDMLI